MLLCKFRQAIEDVQKKTGLKDPLKTAVLTGFLLCDDLEKANRGADISAVKAAEEPENEEQGEAESLALSLISRLDEIMFEETEAPFAHTETESAEEPCSKTGIFKLQNPVKNYLWGSSEWIPALLGRKNISRIPWAELWMGVHPAGPSRIMPDAADEEGPLLSELIETEPSETKPYQHKQRKNHVK